MGRERKLYRWILISATIVAASACCTIADEARTEVKVSFSGGAMSSKAYDPDEERISDISLMIFDESGAAEECIWMTGGSRECTARLILNKEYTAFDIILERCGQIMHGCGVAASPKI